MPISFFTNKRNGTNPVFYRIDRITVFIFIIDYLLRWGTADFKLKGEKPFLRYPFTFFAVVDLIAILSSLTPLYSTLKAVRILRLPKCMKPLKILRLGFWQLGISFCRR